MKELQTIFAEHEKAHSQGTPAVLTTLLRLNGSAYRRPGAHMLVLADGKHFGSVIGACLERDLIEKCKHYLDSDGIAEITEYDTSHDDDEILGSGSGCTGRVQILIEKLSSNEFENPLFLMQSEIQRLKTTAIAKTSGTFSGGTSTPTQNKDLRSALLTVILRQKQNENKVVQTIRFIIHTDSSNEEVGNQLSSSTCGIKISELTAAALIASAERPLNLAQKAIAQNRFCSGQIIVGEQIIDLFAEPLNAPKRLLIFGAGYDAEALVLQASHLGYTVEVYDHRQAMTEATRFPTASAVVHCRYDDKNFPAIDQNSYCILMSHNLLIDKMVLSLLLDRSPAYIGVLGPKRRTARILKQLLEEHTEAGHKRVIAMGESAPQESIKESHNATRSYAEQQEFIREKINRLHAPIGLDIGAETPEEIALSILAEIQAYSQSRQAGFLSDSDEPIHEPYNQSPDSEFSSTTESGAECQISQL